MPESRRGIQSETGDRFPTVTGPKPFVIELLTPPTFAPFRTPPITRWPKGSSLPRPEPPRPMQDDGFRKMTVDRPPHPPQFGEMPESPLRSRSSIRPCGLEEPPEFRNRLEGPEGKETSA
jgi:hypothetical protein